MDYLLVLYKKYNDDFIKYIDKKILENEELVTNLGTLLIMGGYYNIKNAISNNFNFNNFNFK